MYQESELHHLRHTTTKTYADQALADLKSLDDQTQARLEWSDVELMRAVLHFVEMQSWQSSEESSTDDDCLSEIKSALLHITRAFHAPFEAKVVFTQDILVQDKIART